MINIMRASVQVQTRQNSEVVEALGGQRLWDRLDFDLKTGEGAGSG